MQDLPHDRLLCFESLESRRVLAAPNITALSAAASSLDPTGHLTVNASVTDADQDVREVAFYVDNGDGQFDASVDQLIGRDSHASDGWQLSIPTSGPYRIMPLGDSVTQRTVLTKAIAIRCGRI